MSFKPIVLWNPKATLASDDACTTILQYKLPPAPSTIRPPYQSPHDPELKLRYVPPLSYFCIKSLVEYPDEIHTIGPTRLCYHAPWSRDQFDILSALIPTYRPFSDDDEEFDIGLVDPRLWAVLVQVYEGLPVVFRRYALPLSDAHLPLLQTIPSTEHFSLVTVLSLSRCPMLTDDTILSLRHLHTLTALDASATGLGTWGIQRLAKSLGWSEADDVHQSERRGPWGLRILYLRNCMNIDTNVLVWLLRFPLLSVVDLRGTVCQPWRRIGFPFQACGDLKLYHPTELSMALDHLYETKVNKKKRPLFSHPEPFVLCVDSLHHKPPPTTSHAHPLNDHYADIGDTYADASTKRGQQVASGRLDVFLPWKPPRERPSDHFMDWQTHKGHADLYDTSNGDEDEDDGGDPGYDYDSYGSDRPNDDDDYDQPEGPWWNNDDDEWGRGLAPRSPGLEPDPDDDSDVLWMNEVAEDEAGLYLRQRDAVMFYRNAVPRRTSSLPDFGSRTRHRQGQLIEPPAEKKEDPLMIFRTPPPWGALPSSPPAKPASRAAPPSARGVPTSVFASGTRPPSPSKSSSKALLSSHDPQNPVKFPPTFTMPPPATGHSPPFKRRRIEQTGPADQARRSMHALSSIQSLFSMVQKRTDDATAQLRDSKGKGRVIGSGATGRINPFARAVQEGKPKSILGVKRKVSAGPVGKSESESSLDSGSSRSTAHPTASPAKVKPHRRDHVTPTKSKPSQGSTATPKPSATEASTSTVASETPPPAKKLKPITSLPVPDWPNAHFKPVSEHRPKPAPVKARVQTTLPVSRPSKETVKPPDGDSERRRVSAPVMVTPRLKSGPAGQPQQSARSKEGKEKSKAPSKGGKGKEVKAGPFDWNKWSTAG